MPLKLNLPFKHFFVTQKWGVPNPAYEQFGFKNHNGVDCSSTYNDATTSYNPKTWPVWCPTEGFTVHTVRYMPNGGGNELWMISNQKVQMGDKLCHAYMVMAHAEKIFVKPGDKPLIGQLLMIADNTGFSTGPHTHWGLYRVDWDGAKVTFLDTNDAANTHDPALYFTKLYAVDLASYSTLVSGAFTYAKYMIGA